MILLPERADLAPADDDVDRRAIVTIRMMAADAVQTAGSGHPGLPMGAATPAYVLWSRFLRHDPACPTWPDRDRFVLSAGHGSMLLYSLLHLFGYGLPLDEIKAFRQWGSRTPGHPEFGHTAGVETTTGPLGQGLGNAVGMALAECMLAARYNTGDLPPLVDHRTYVLASDGDLMEGISHEAASLAGHLGLGRLIVLYDDNRITIDGSAGLSCSDDVCARFGAYGWHVQRVEDGENISDVDAALRQAVADEGRPSLIAIRTHIGYGSPGLQDTPAVHGAPLGEEELARTKRRFAWPLDERFHVPEDVRHHLSVLAGHAFEERSAWDNDLAKARATHPGLVAEWDRAQAGELPPDIDLAMPDFRDAPPMATRKASGAVLQGLSKVLPDLVGGSADLETSTCTEIEGGSIRTGDYRGRTVHFGIREHAMGGVLNGLALHRGLRPFGSTFLVFSDYMRPAIRLAALMRLPIIYIFTHDSIGVGEDGPTHQPVEHLTALRTIPNLAVLRPADPQETAQAWDTAVRRSDGPTALVLTRQAVLTLPPPPEGVVEGAGAWVALDDEEPDVVLIATGSEVSLAVSAAQLLREDGVAPRVVSMPWRERFLALPDEAVENILPASVPRVVVEAGTPDMWTGLAGPSGRVLGLDRFGASAPGPELMDRLGFSPKAVYAAVREFLGLRSNDLG